MPRGGNGDLQITGVIEFILKKLGLSQAQAGLKGTGEAAKRAGRDFGAMEKASASLGSTLNRYLGAAALGALLKSSVTEFAKVERGFGALKIQMEGLGLSSGKQLPRVQAFLEGLQDAGDGMLSETIPAFQKFLSLTGKVEASISLVKLASNMAESGLGGLTDATGVLNSLLTGQANRALKEWGINVRESADGSLDAKEALEKLFEKFPDQISNIEDMQDSLDKLAGKFLNLTRGIGSAISKTGSFFRDAKDFIGEGFDLIKKDLGFGGDRGGELRVMEGLGAPQNAAAAAKEQADTAAKARQEALDAAKKAHDAKDREKREREAREAREHAERIADAEFEVQDNLRHQLIKQSVEGSDERLKLVLADLDKEEAQAIEVAKRTGKEIEGIHETYEIARREAMLATQKYQQELQTQDILNAQEIASRKQQLVDEEVQREKERIEAQRDAEAELLALQLTNNELTLEDRARIEKELIRLDTMRRLSTARSIGESLAIWKAGNAQMAAVDKAVADDKIALGLEVAGAWSGAMQAMFGENKNLAIAQAIIDTWAGATRALKDYPWPFSAGIASAVIAAGFANVAKIESTSSKARGGREEKKGTFDSPSNDQTLFMGTQKSVDDFLRITRQAANRAADRFVEQEGPPVSMDQSVHIHGNVYGGDPGLRQLSREMERAGRHDLPRRLR